MLGLGNDLLADDAVGILAARRLANELSGNVDVVESPLSGVALLEHFLGFERAIVIDAIRTGVHPPGTIVELDPAELDAIPAPSPHYAGFPELVTLARELDLAFPSVVKILAVEVVDLHTIGGGLSPVVEEALPRLVERVKQQVALWSQSP